MNNNQGRRRVRRNRRQKKTQISRILLTICMMALVAVVSIGGTVAWLTDATQTVTNTFTDSDVDVSLAETTTDYKMVPGVAIAKDPKVTVEMGSEACYVFVKIDKNVTYNTYLNDYEVTDKWDWLDITNTGKPKPETYEDTEWFYYTQAATTTEAASEYVLAGGTNGQVVVKDNVTKAMMDALIAETNPTANPTLSFTAYAVQQAGSNNAYEAWQKLGITDSTPTP